MNAVIMLTVMILMVATGVSVGQDSREMDITVQVSLLSEYMTSHSVSLVLYCRYQ